MSQSFFNTTIYEIFRACRLCGAGGGYKMPIIPSVVGFDCADIELRQKIRECVQIEVDQDDKMPPLICELCVDKVNDFYEFLAMCRDTNTKTRQRLGLPEQNPQNIPEGDDCILGVTEPVFTHDDDDEPLSRRSTRGPVKVKKEDKKNDKKNRVKSLKKELENLIKHENTSSRDSRSSRGERRLDSSSSSRSSRNRRSPSPPVRETRQSVTSDKDVSLSRLKEQQKKYEITNPKYILKKEKEEIFSVDSSDDMEEPEPAPAPKRARDQAARDEQDTPNKKIKLTIKLPPRPPTPPRTKPRPGPKCSKRAESPPNTFKPAPPGPKTSKPGPKSSKLISTPDAPDFILLKPGPKSSKRSISPTPKSSKRALSPPLKSSKRAASPSLKSSKRAASPPLKSSKRALSPPLKSSKLAASPSLKSSKRSASPLLKSSKRALSPPLKSSKRAASPALKSTKRAASPAPDYACAICSSVLQSPQGYSSHVRSHTVKFTANDLACNPCGEWFTTADEATAHHKQHKHKNKPYRCRGCRAGYRVLADYNQHIAETSCAPWTEVPDVKCPLCWKEFPTDCLREEHRCGGRDARPGGKCSKCSRHYQTLKTLKKHESTCAIKKKLSDPLSEVKISPAVRKRLLRAQVRMVRADALLAANKRRRYDVSNIRPDFGIDRSCVYPYRACVRVKQEPLAFDGMVSINKDVRDEFYVEEDYVHWDSDNSTSSGEEFSLVTPSEKKKKVPSLTTLSLKTIFSRRCLGKVPRKLRKVRSEKFDSFFNPETEFDNVQDDINNIISNLNDDNEENENGFSVNNIKLTDVKSISETVTDNDSINIDINDTNLETNYESDSLLEDKQQNVASEDKDDFDVLKSSENLNNEQNTCNILNNNIGNVNADNGSETDASLDDIKSESHCTKQKDEKDTASENSQDLDIETTNKSVNLPNGNTLATETVVEKSNGATEHHSDLINDINELYDKGLMEELDAQIGDKEVNLMDKADKISLEDLVGDKINTTSGLDDISDDEFNFDT